MRFTCFRLDIFGFSELDRQIEKMRVLRDSYREANVAHFGVYLASLLDD